MAIQQRKERHVVIEWSDVKHKFLRVVGDDKPWGTGINKLHHTAREFRTWAKPNKLNEFQSFEGSTPTDMLERTRNGYRAEEFVHSAEYVPIADKKRPSWTDEPDGDLDVGRLYGGYDNPYLTRSMDEKKPGIRVMIEFAFACGVSNETINQYGAWVAGLLGSLESSGYDATVDLWIPLDGLFMEQTEDHMGNKRWTSGRGRDNVLVRVKRENELSDFTEWSSLFAPGGYRMLGFCAKLVAGDKIGKLCSSGLGTTHSGPWDLSYDRENSILKINVNQQGGYWDRSDAFPKDKLNAKAQELGLLPKAEA